MGTCCCSDDTVVRDKETDSKQRQPSQASAPLKPRPAVPIVLRVDMKNEQIRSYKLIEGNEFMKNIYNWHAIPINSAFDFNQRSSFSVTSLGIKDDNFVIGAIKKSAMTGVTKMPWKTNNAICFESHMKAGESGVIFNKDISRSGRGLRMNETLTVSIERERIDFHIGQERVGSRDIPSEFLSDQICPYVALFTDGDRVRLEGEVQKVTR